MNGEGRRVLIGVGPDGRLVGHEVADTRLLDIAAMRGCYTPWISKGFSVSLTASKEDR